MVYRFLGHILYKHIYNIWAIKYKKVEGYEYGYQKLFKM